MVFLVCLWIQYFRKKIIDNAKRLKDGYVLIDDGWTKHGDWETQYTNKFPGGMKYLAKEIKSLGFKPGLWIAPFFVNPKSFLAHEHEDWLIKDKHKYIEGFNVLPFTLPFVRFRYVLDPENPKVMRYIKDCIINIVENWGFELLKLDFLYTIYFNPRYKDTKIPDQILREFLTFIKKRYPSVYTIGCGCPLGPAAGLVDAMRISGDITTPQLNNIWPINKIVNSQKLKLLENNLQYRTGFEKVWNIDPDVFIAGKETGFSQKQAQKLYQLIKSTQGLFFLGDNLTKTKPKNYF